LGAFELEGVYSSYIGQNIKLMQAIGYKELKKKQNFS
jgi:hypothetical protein